MPKLSLSLASKPEIIVDHKAVNNQDVIYSDPIVIESDEYFGLFIKVDARTLGQDPHLKITRQYNWSNNIPPDDNLWAAIDETGSENIVSADFIQQSWCCISEIFKYSIWARYKIEGLDTNGSDTIITMVIVRQKKERL